MFDQLTTSPEEREEALLGRIASTAQQIAHLQARQLRDMATLQENAAGTDLADFVSDELAMTLTMSPTAANNRLDLANVLTRRLPDVLGLLSRGEIDLYRAQIFAEGTARLDDATAAAVAAALLHQAPGLTATQLRAKLRKILLEIDPEGADKRRKRAREDRKVELYDEDDAMATLFALLPAEEALLVYKSVDQLARAAAKNPDETRTLKQLRADFLVEIHREILETGAWNPREMSTPRRAQPHVQVTVDLLTLLGLRLHPGYLEGYGPVPPSVARMIAEDATWQRLITDPIGGQLLDYGTKKYAPGPVLDAHVVARDQTCRFPGCTRPAANSDLDHTVAFPDGPTSDRNLGALCRHHHRAKQAGFTLRQPSPGVFVWRSPGGKQCTVRPPGLGPPHPGQSAKRGNVTGIQRLTKIALEFAAARDRAR